MLHNLPLEAGLNFSGIKGILMLVAGIVVMVAGIAIANTGKKGNFKKAAESAGGVLIGVLIIAIGASFAIFSGAASKFVAFFVGS